MKLFDVYPLMDMEPVEANGSYVTDHTGRRYLDLYGGHAVISIGHSHPVYVERLKNQLDQIGFYSNSVRMPLQEQLADALGRISGYPEFRLFLCNSGAEANENAIKLASFHNKRKKIIAFQKSFHGRTSLAVAATDDIKLQAPVNTDHEIVFLPLNDEEALAAHLNDEVCAVIIEGIQGVGGVHVPEKSFLQFIRKKCDETGALMILDEVQSGYGRSGTFFAHQQSAVVPDLITVAKGMGNGFPVAGVLIAPQLSAKHGMLGTTFGGSYLACTAALAVLEVIEEEHLMHRAKVTGEYLMKELRSLASIKEIRGMGLMIGIEMYEPCASTRNNLLKTYGIMTGASSDPNTLRILPALNLSITDATYFIESFKQLVQS